MQATFEKKKEEVVNKSSIVTKLELAKKICSLNVV